MVKDLMFKLRGLYKSEMIRVFSLTSISTIVKMITGFVSIKFLAIIIGSSGIALLGQLNNFISIALSLATGGINSGITKYIAEEKDSKKKIQELLSNALIITISCSSLVGILMIIFHRYISYIIMGSLEYGYLFIIFGFTVFLYALNLMLTSILNGYKEFHLFVKINIITSIVGLVFTIVMVSIYQIVGALLSTILSQSIIFIISLFMVRKLPWASRKFFCKKFSSIITRRYLQYTLMAITTAILLPISQILIRSSIITNISITEAGWWESMNRISNMYLTIITSSFGVYYLPKLSELKTDNELRHEIYNAYKIILPVLFFSFMLIYLFRISIIKILFAPEFIPMENLFIWQLFGDFMKIAGWLLAFLMVAKSMTTVYILSEILYSSAYIFISFLLMPLSGIIGITISYSLCYTIYFLSMIFLFRKILYTHKYAIIKK